MATIVKGITKSNFEVILVNPENQWVSDIASFLGMSKEAVVAAAFGHGITYYWGMCQGLKRHNKDVKHDTDSNGA